MNPAATRLLLAYLLLGCFCLIGCDSTSPVTKVNFDKVNKGMTEQEVENILGSPTQQGKSEDLMANVPGMKSDAKLPGLTYKVWAAGGNKISAQFLDGKLVSKSWVGT